MSNLTVVETVIPGVKVIQPRIFLDDRGWFLESWQRESYAAAGLPGQWVQDNISWSRGGVLRGLHFQEPNAQGKLVSCARGEVFDVAVDIRLGSPTFGHWVGETLSERNGYRLWIPAGFAHGFVVTGEEALFVYKCDAPYSPTDEGGLRWNDPNLAIAWPVDAPNLSAKDAEYPTLTEIDQSRLPRYLPAD